MALPESEPKDPSAIVDYVLDLNAIANGNSTTDTYLETGETITSVVSVTSSDITLDIDSYSIINAGTSIRIWVSGGTVGTKVTITTRFLTSMSPRQDERSFTIKIKEL